MKTYGERLLEAMNYAGLNQDDLANAAGIKQPSVNYLIKKGSGSKHTNTFAKLCGVNAMWLEREEGSMKRGQSTVNSPKEKYAVNPLLQNVIESLHGKSDDELLAISSIIRVLSTLSGSSKPIKGKKKL